MSKKQRKRSEEPVNTDVEKKALIESVLDRVRKKAADYFPDLGKGKASKGLIVWLAPEKFRSSNPVYVIEINPPEGVEGKTRRVVAKYISSSDCPAGPGAEFRALSELYQNREFKELGFAVPRPIDYFDDLRILITGMVEGRKLPLLLGEENGRFAKKDKVDSLLTLMEKCGLCLKLIHGKGVTKTAPLPADLIGRLEKCTLYLEEKGLFAKGEVMAVVNTAIAKIGLRPITYVRQHGDYNIGNLMVTDDKLAVIDFTYAREDLPQNDIGRFLMALETFLPFKKNLFFDFKRIPAFEERFLTGYYGKDRARAPLDRLLIHLYKLRMILIHFKARHEAYSRQKKSAHLLIMNRLYKKRANETLAEIRKHTALL